MKWTPIPPIHAGYYWAIPKDRDPLDGVPEIVCVVFNGSLYAYRPGMESIHYLNEFDWWSDQPIIRPELNDEIEKALEEEYNPNWNSK